MIDLHLHTTASDGRLTPARLVARAAEVGLTVMAVTDHDTVQAVEEVTRLAAAHGIRVVPGVEITAVHEERDVHLLAYFVDHREDAFVTFLDRQRGLREERAREIGRRLTALNVPIDMDELLAHARATPGTAIARPWLARALVAAGHVGSIQEAFDRYLAAGQPAFVPRIGLSPFEVLDVGHRAGGIVSFAHPGVTKKDHLLEPLAEAGLDAIEVHHSDHSPEASDRYRSLADRLGLGISGGSDFHGYGETRATLGSVCLPADDFVSLEARAAARAGARP